MNKTYIQPLEPTISTSGTAFRISNGIKKDVTFSPDTKGFLSYIIGPDYNNPNIVFHKVVTIRRGKRGKERLNVNILLSPIFNLPGVRAEWLIPADVERKFLVDIVTLKGVTTNIISPKITNNLSFIGKILSRALLTVALDKVLYSSNDKIMQTIGLLDHKTMNVWPKNKTSQINTFVKEAESLFNENNQDIIYDNYCNEEARAALLKELNDIDVCLAVPRLEYQRKVLNVMLEALDFIKTKLNEASIKERPDKVQLLKRVGITKKGINNRKHNVSKAIDTRLITIVQNRKIS
jgi:hypothetical protein